MSKRNLKHLLLSCFVAISFAANAQQNFSVEEAVQYAIRNHSSTKKDVIKIADAEAQMKAIKATGLPQLNGSAEYQYFIEVPAMPLPKEFDPTGEGGTIAFQKRNNLNLGLNASMLAFDGSYLVALKAAKLYREYVRSQTEITPITIRKNVTDSYYTVLIAEKNKAQLEKNINIIQTLRKEVGEIYKAGLNEKLDVDRIDLSISNLQSTINVLSRNIEILKNVLKFQMQLPMDQQITLTDNFDVIYNEAQTEQSKSVEQLNIQNRPEYRSIGKGIELAKLDIDRFKKGYLPSLSVFGSFGRGFQSDNIFKSGGLWIPTSLVGIKLAVPIYDGGAKKANIQRAQIVVETNIIDRNDFERATNLEVINAQQSYLNALETVKDKQKSLDLAQEIFRVSQVKYKEGIGASFETQQAEAELYSAQAGLIQAQSEVITSKFAIEKALGNFE
ncbi:MAG: TolC family protein [Saprospiraceae bacterium]|jgi:outer membrane protein|uniref:TolC family protein n=1 Tax=Candidatus Brachybacter algidus TaxID=2982024 RepID=UPI001B6193D0|nr:TolC family protein [Candidatus Brachybacter algidus]MBP7304854.1 TolC family protein [Saprospiraceae bacterium]MBK6373324.1 TolC family protein [Candidatus Brachybacter algidus]MBK6447973.1 TolC family protein [Candidatus Brachybacter algidus]MBK8354554.1 TolC family protein [Candidatus Brachybacter algidus]MBK8602189.1 TolC family protein [Candidatus Brachybacter algidus]